MDRVDFRSDTVTWPTPAMREAMAHARLGDDVYGEDPTVNELEAVAAARVGKEAGLFVPSGTMGNQAAILSHAGRGDEAILAENAHVYLWEAGGMASLGGVVPLPLPTDRQGRMDPARVEAAIREDDPHLARSRLLLLENTTSACSGSPLPPEYFATMRQVAVRHNLKIHLDGARLFNAAVAQEVDVATLTRDVDSVSFCLSKGLCAPVGSVLCGSTAFIHQARRVRKVLGGGMRQAGILAAAGLVALQEMVDRLAEDHRRARELAAGLSEVPGIALDLQAVRTNMVYFDLEERFPLTAEELAGRLRDDHDILIDPERTRTLRALTHYWIRDEDVHALVDGIRSLASP